MRGLVAVARGALRTEVIGDCEHQGGVDVFISEHLRLDAEWSVKSIEFIG